MSQIDYFFWMNSDWALLGASRLEMIAARHGAAINYKPVDLPEVYRRTGGLLLGDRSPERHRYRAVELARWCDLLDYKINPMPKYMCPDAELASRLVIAAIEAGFEPAPISTAILRAEWCEDRNIADPAELLSILAAGQYDARALLRDAHRPEIGQTYRNFTDQAVAAGVFGSPSYVFHEELFWGQDRLWMLEAALSKISGMPLLLSEAAAAYPAFFAVATSPPA